MPGTRIAQRSKFFDPKERQAQPSLDLVLESLEDILIDEKQPISLRRHCLGEWHKFQIQIQMNEPQEPIHPEDMDEPDGTGQYSHVVIPDYDDLSGWTLWIKSARDMEDQERAKAADHQIGL